MMNPRRPTTIAPVTAGEIPNAVFIELAILLACTPGKNTPTPNIAQTANRIAYHLIPSPFSM